MQTSIHKYTDYQNDHNLINQIMELIEPSYKIAGKHIKKDIDICNELYVIENEERQMLALFMVGFHSIENLECCYVGLSACRHEYKKNGLTKKLYFEFLRDCAKKGEELNKRIVCYGTTASPIVYYAFHNIWADVQPDIEGNCSNEGKDILLKIAQEKYPQADFTEQTPFLLRHAASQINYSDVEKQRILDANKKLQLSVFDRFELNETNGDRFLMIGYSPQLDQINKLINNSE